MPETYLVFILDRRNFTHSAGLYITFVGWLIVSVVKKGYIFAIGNGYIQTLNIYEYMIYNNARYERIVFRLANIL